MDVSVMTKNTCVKYEIINTTEYETHAASLLNESKILVSHTLRGSKVESER